MSGRKFDYSNRIDVPMQTPQTLSVFRHYLSNQEQAWPSLTENGAPILALSFEPIVEGETIRLAVVQDYGFPNYIVCQMDRKGRLYQTREFLDRDIAFQVFEEVMGDLFC